jgi:hypothetical protein
VKELLAAAVELPTEARKPFLDAHCDDPEMRAEVDALLRYASERPISDSGNPLENIEAALAADLERSGDRSEPAARSLASTVLSHYLLGSLLGTGGMGDVYRARDLRLEREVAVKILSEHLAATPQAVRRFEREVRAVAALSHPNVVAIHDVGSERGIHYAVMELLEGESLRACLQRGVLPWRQAVSIAIAVAEGLAAAHIRGIIHRDLKPENIFLTREGAIKVLDFWDRADDVHGRMAERRRHQLDPAVGGARNAGVHVARASAGRGGRATERSLRPRLRAL